MLTNKIKYAVKVDLTGDGTPKVYVSNSSPIDPDWKPVLFDTRKEAEPMVAVWGPTAEIVEYKV
jgi:hypothetical protein